MKLERNNTTAKSLRMWLKKILIPNLSRISRHIKLKPTNVELFQSRLNKNVSYRYVLGQEKKD